MTDNRTIGKVEITRSGQGRFWIQKINFHGKIVVTKMTETHSEALETAQRLAGNGFKAKVQDRTA
jgi:hypothetical protein